MTEAFKGFKFPAYKEIEKLNNVFLDHNEYKGYSINIPVNDIGLYMLIDCQNDQVVNMGENCIRFAWCNKAGFAIASVKYKNCEAGYLMGCAFLINSANEMSKCFVTFINKNTHDIRTRFHEYNIKNEEN